MHVSDKKRGIRVTTIYLADVPQFDVFKVGHKFYRKHKNFEVREQMPGARAQLMAPDTRVLWVGVKPDPQ